MNRFSLAVLALTLVIAIGGPSTGLSQVVPPINSSALMFQHFLVSLFRTRRDRAFENLVLRQPLAVLKENVARPQLSQTDRHWTAKCRKQGRPPIDPKVRALIRRMCAANPLWGAPRIHGELLKLGIDVSEAVVSRYMIRTRMPPSQIWRKFLANHARDIIAIHSNVTESPAITTVSAHTSHWKRIRRRASSSSSRTEAVLSRAGIVVGCIMSISDGPHRMN